MFNKILCDASESNVSLNKGSKRDIFFSYFTKYFLENKDKKFETLLQER